MNRSCSPFAAMIAFVMSFGLATSAQAKTLIFPHLLEQSGGLLDATNTFDTQIFLTYTADGGVPDPTGSADFSVYLFDQTTGAPLQSATGGDVANPMGGTVNNTFLSTHQINVDQAIVDAGGFPQPIVFGYVIVVISGDEDNVNVTSTLTNVKSGPLDVAVFGFEPQEIIASDISDPPSTQLRLDNLRETPGSPTQFGGCVDTLFQAVYTPGLIDGQTPSSVGIELLLFKPDGTPLRASIDDPGLKYEFILDANNRVFSQTLDELINAAGGFTEPVVNAYAVATLTGDWRNVTLDAYVIESGAGGPHDLIRYDQVLPTVIPEPGAILTLCAAGMLTAMRRRRR